MEQLDQTHEVEQSNPEMQPHPYVNQGKKSVWLKGLLKIQKRHKKARLMIEFRRHTYKKAIEDLQKEREEANKKFDQRMDELKKDLEKNEYNSTCIEDVFEDTERLIQVHTNWKHQMAVIMSRDDEDIIVSSDEEIPPTNGEEI